MAALVRLGLVQFGARVLQKRKRCIHMRLRAKRVTNSEARNDRYAQQQFLS
jgi:hypothetical protein